MFFIISKLEKLVFIVKNVLKSPSKGCKKNNVYCHKNEHYSIKILQYIHVTPITGSGILSGFQITLQNISETCSF
jgi:hypothetical protein